MAPDLPTALSDIIQAGDAWIAERITFGRETILDGEDLAQAVRSAPDDADRAALAGGCTATTEVPAGTSVAKAMRLPSA